MKIKYIFLTVVLLLPFVLFAQKGIDKKNNIGALKDNNDDIINIDNPDLQSINPLNPNHQNNGNKQSGVFNIISVDKSKISSTDVNSQIVTIRSETRKNPLALYVNNNIKNLKNITSNKTLAYSILGDRNVKESMEIGNEKNFHIVSIVTDDLGITHIKMNQYYKGLMIFGGQIYIHYKKDKTYSVINGRWYKDSSIKKSKNKDFTYRNIDDFSFTLNESHIKNIIKAELESKRIKLQDFARFGDQFIPDKQWTIQRMLFQPEGQEYLVPVYVVDVVADPMHRFRYILDSNRGDFLRKQKEYCSLIDESNPPTPEGATIAHAKDLHGVTRDINVYNTNNHYYMIDVSRDMFNSGKSKMPDDPYGTIWTIDANNTNPNNDNFSNSLSHVHSGNNTWNALSVSAHFNAGFAYDYYKNKFNRNSINGTGGNVVSIINVADEDGAGMDNAFWGGSAMFYGNGNKAFSSPLAKALDVSGHELTHGVIQSTANLEYYGESGAINESFADVFGAMMDRDNWQMGEDVVNPQYFPSGALRDLSNPHNGASQGSYAWQPANTNEKYTGTEDNAGVHTNSGIPNYAFYKFATAVGKEKAENVYYRALTFYLTKSSKFVDLRVAIEQSAEDLYDANVKNAASDAFAAVGIGTSGGSGGSGGHQGDLSINPGQDFIICTSGNNNGLYLLDANGQLLNNGHSISNTTIQSKISITDDGRNVIFVGDDNKIHYIYINWQTGDISENIIQDQPIWRNAVISKDGTHLAALYSEINKKIAVYDFGIQEWKDFELKNPTTVQGVELGNVEFADAMEFDYSGEWLMYDCKNLIGSNGGLEIEYWDIGFINVWNNSNNYFADGRIEKLFSELPEDVSIGNPVFSKNSPYIIAFDYISNETYNILGANIETGDVKLIFNNVDLGYPNYSKDDKKLIYDYYDNGYSLAIIDLNNDKISSVVNSAKYFVNGARWGVWFSNGVRDLTSAVTEVGKDMVSETFLYPNPVSNVLNIKTKDFKSDINISIFDILGNQEINKVISLDNSSISLDISKLKTGNYIVKITDGKKFYTDKIMVIK